jgi:hypothetical protein
MKINEGKICFPVLVIQLNKALFHETVKITKDIWEQGA